MHLWVLYNTISTIKYSNMLCMCITMIFRPILACHVINHMPLHEPITCPFINQSHAPFHRVRQLQVEATAPPPGISMARTASCLAVVAGEVGAHKTARLVYEKLHELFLPARQRVCRGACVMGRRPY